MVPCRCFDGSKALSLQPFGPRALVKKKYNELTKKSNACFPSPALVTHREKIVFTHTHRCFYIHVTCVFTRVETFTKKTFSQLYFYFLTRRNFNTQKHVHTHKTERRKTVFFFPAMESLSSRPPAVSLGVPTVLPG